ncbi:hypothetical protein FSP39_017905, partial [Pinctada imbricata]
LPFKIVTGASAGIGEGIALHLAKLGASLSLTGRNKDNLNKVAESCKAQGANEEKILVVAGELTSGDFRKTLMQKTLEKFGKLDVLVNNAGMIHYASATETTEEVYDETMDVNTRCHFFLTNLAVPALKESKGVMSGVAVYCMSKAAMDSYTECLALELAPFGVRVNSINPGTIVSMIARREHSKYQDDKDYEKFLETQVSRHPLGRVGYPKDIADAVAFLASEQASFISGQILYVDGARHCVSVAVATSVK